MPLDTPIKSFFDLLCAVAAHDQKSIVDVKWGSAIVRSSPNPQVCRFHWVGSVAFSYSATQVLTPFGVFTSRMVKEAIEWESTGVAPAWFKDLK